MLHPGALEQHPAVDLVTSGVALRCTDGQHLQPEVAHLVGGAVAVMHAHWRVGGVARVGGGVVVDVAHVQDRARGQEQRLAVAVDRLAVDVPVLNKDERRALAVRRDGPCFELLAEIVRVRIDAQRIDGDGQAQLVFDDEVAVAGRDVECGIVLELQQHGSAGGRRVREVEADARLHGFDAAGGLEVGVEDEVIAGIDAPGHAGRLDDGGRVGLPEEEVAVGIEAIAGADFELHAGDAGPPVVRVLAAELGGAVDEDVGVVDDARVAGKDLDSANVAGARDIDGIDEVAEEVLAVGGNGEGLRRSEDEIGAARAATPMCIRGAGGASAAMPSGMPGADPALDVRRGPRSERRRLSAKSPYPGSGSQGGM